MARKKEKILVALSGGVDSAVAAALLVRQGYDVAGAYMVNYESDDRDEKSKCWTGDYRDALRVAAKLGIPLLRLNFTKEYKKYVLDYMYSEYEKGNTPNPDILCNKYIKFGFWLNKARELGFSKLATGHYARVGEINNYKLIITNNKTKVLFEAKDKNKDQTYFLHQLNQEQLKDILFPIGEYTKPEVRKLAKKFALPVADKEESMGICFVGEVPMKEFLEKKIKAKSGKVLLSSGEIIGEHDGLAFFTIGQRHIGITRLRFATPGGPDCWSKPLYVVGKNIKKNELIVGGENDPLLYKKIIYVGDVNWIGGHEPKFPLKCLVRLRHRQTLQKCRITNYPPSLAGATDGQSELRKTQTYPFREIVVEFDEPQRAPASGQFAVFYLNGLCLGGGTIC